MEIVGLILNQTRTRFGQDFYREFSMHWVSPQEAGNYNILIKELPDPRWGSFIWIYVDNAAIFKTVIGRRPEEIETAVQKGIQTVLAHLIRRTIDPQAAQDGDLAGDGW